MTTVLGTLVAVLSGLVGLGWWYHGYRTRALETRAAAAEAAVGALKSVNSELRAALDRVVADVADRNAREAEADAAVAEAARTDSRRAAELLNQLGTRRKP